MTPCVGLLHSRVHTVHIRYTRHKLLRSICVPYHINDVILFQDMKALVLRKTGGPEVLKVEEVEEPTARKGQVKVKIHFVGINYADILSRKGLYGWAVKRPYILGMEASGVIEEVGEGRCERLGNIVRLDDGAVSEGLSELVFCQEIDIGDDTLVLRLSGTLEGGKLLEKDLVELRTNRPSASESAQARSFDTRHQSFEGAGADCDPALRSADRGCWKISSRPAWNA